MKTKQNMQNVQDIPKNLMIEFSEVRKLWALFDALDTLGTLGTFWHSGHF